MSSYILDSFANAYVAEMDRKKEQTKSGKSLFVSMIERRSRANMDSRIIIEGEAGLGISYTVLKMGELLDKRFTEDPQGAIEDQVFFSASEFLNAVQKLPPLSVLIYDEPGQSFHHREFMSEANVILSKMMIGYRFKRFITMLCVPSLGMIDKDAKTLVSFLVNVTAHGKAEVYKQIPDKFGGTTWFKDIISDLHIPMPAIQLRHAYEKKKEVIQDKLYASYGKILSEREKPRVSNADIIEIVLKDPEKYKTHDKKGDFYSVTTLTGEFDISRERARAIRHKLNQNP